MSTYIDERKHYWDEKYLEENTFWGQDIHFGIFSSSEINYNNFLEALKLNTELLTREILDISSVYFLSKEFKIIDFGCGSGDLLFRLHKLIPNAICTGIDLSDNAIIKANNTKNKLVNKDSHSTITFISGGVSALSGYVKNSIDLIICRDMFYLLNKTEQDELLSFVSTLLKPSGRFVLADFAVTTSAKDQISTSLIKRQFGGEPILYDDNIEHFSIQSMIGKFRLQELHYPKINHTAFSYSYSAAASNILDSNPTKNAYLKLAEISKPNESSGKSNVPYVRFFIGPVINSLTNNKDNFGLAIKKNISFGSKSSFKNILESGNFMFPLNKWSLIVGKSGVGKSTLLNYLSSIVQNKNVTLVNIPSRVFYLKQNPVLIEELSVEANLALFGMDNGLVNRVLISLGLDNEIRKRTVSSNLSGGEIQRVALGQAIVSNPDLLLLDEPCTGMDKAIKFHFFSLLKEEFKNKQISILCVDHDFHLIESFFDNIYELNNGSLRLISEASI